jgi:uncharacterized protein (DUF58 family)
LKTVDWKATARMHSLHVRTYEPSSTHTVVLVVAVDTMTPHWEAYLSSDLERVITAAASVAAYAVGMQYAVGLFSNDMPTLADKPMTVPPSNGPEQMATLLEALAMIRPYALAPMSKQLPENSRRFPLGASLVVCTSFLPPEFVDTLNELRSRGFRIVVMYVGSEKCPSLENGIVVHEMREHLDTLEAVGEPVAG